MKKYYIILLILMVVCMTGCLKETDNDITLNIAFKMPEEYADMDLDMTKIEVKLQNKDIPFTFTTNPDKEGIATFNVQPGKYDVVASAYFKENRTAVNASVPEFIVSESRTIETDLILAIPNPLIIREIYYQGSQTFEGSSYSRDQYFELYNNAGPGGKTVYLDSICAAVIYPANSTTANNAWLGRDTIPIFQMFWMFPGNGNTYPLDPGESCVVAITSAVDHSERATSGLQLNKAHFGCWAEHLTRHEIAAGVTPMICYMAGKGTGWGFSVNSPAFVIFKPDRSIDEYMDQGYIWERFEPGTTSGTKYWHIPKTWILDGVECFARPDGGMKRLPGDIDASYVCMESPTNSGKCITRKVEFTTDGIEVFFDTNNSDNDFIPDMEPSPRLKD